MRGRVCGALVLGVLLANGVGRADEQAEALKVVDAAIQAAGGAAKLDKLKMVSLKGKGTIKIPGEEGTFTLEGTAQGLDRFRLDMEVSFQDKTVKLQMALVGDKGWAREKEFVGDAPAEMVAVFKAEMHALQMAQTLTSLKDKDVKLSPLGEMKIADRAALGIKIVKKDHPDLDLHFDKETHLPVKCELRVKGRNGQEVTSEWLFSGYKEAAGVKHPMKVALNHDGKKLLELEISEVKPEEKVDENVFAKP